MTVNLRSAIDECVERVQQAATFTDWGGSTFRAELELLTNDVSRSQPNQFGCSEFIGRVRRTLNNRLLLVSDRRHHPEIALQKITAPLVVLGLPRSGTTFLHSLLAQDPANRSVAEWEASYPSPPPETSTYRTNPRIEKTRAATPVDPGWQEKHIHDAELPIECGPAFFNYEFLTMGYDCRWRVPNYRERMKDRVPSAYAWHQKCLQHFQSRMNRERWVLKSPEHLAHLEELFLTYPDVQIIFTHRDPAIVAASLASMVSYMRRPHYDEVDSEALRRSTARDGLDYWEHALRKALKFRGPSAADPHFFDVTYRDLIADPMRIVREAYGHFRLPMAAEGEAAMQAWLADHQQDRHREMHGTHEYALESYGLDSSELRERFRDYLQKFDL